MGYIHLTPFSYFLCSTSLYTPFLFNFFFLPHFFVTLSLSPSPSSQGKIELLKQGHSLVYRLKATSSTPSRWVDNVETENDCVEFNCVSLLPSFGLSYIE